MCGLMGGLMVGSAHAAALVADYTFANASNLGLDSSGNGNNATLVQNVSQATGPSAGTTAGVFGQTSEFQINGGLTGYNGQPGFSLSAWVYVSGAYGGYNGVISQDFGGCCINRLLLGTGTTPFINAGAHNDTVPSGDVLPVGHWYNIVMTSVDVTGGNVTDIYVNGALKSTINYGNTLPNLTGVNTYLGAGEDGGPYRLSGDLADVRIYQGALTASDVSGLYAAGADSVLVSSAASAVVPEPGAILLLGVGAIGLGAVRRRR